MLFSKASRVGRLVVVLVVRVDVERPVRPGQPPVAGRQVGAGPVTRRHVRGGHPAPRQGAERRTAAEGAQQGPAGQGRGLPNHWHVGSMPPRLRPGQWTLRRALAHRTDTLSPTPSLPVRSGGCAAGPPYRPGRPRPQRRTGAACRPGRSAPPAFEARDEVRGPDGDGRWPRGAPGGNPTRTLSPPSGRDHASTVPPCAAATAATMDRPRPSPSRLRTTFGAEPAERLEEPGHLVRAGSPDRCWRSAGRDARRRARSTRGPSSPHPPGGCAVRRCRRG